MQKRRGPAAPLDVVARGLEPSPAAGRPPLITGPLLVRFVSVIGAKMSFFLPLPVVPLYVKSSGSGSGAGLATGALPLATVAGELATPRLVSRAGYRLSLATGLFLLGASALALLSPVSLAGVAAVSILDRARNRVPSPMGGGVSSSTPVMAGLNDGSLRESATVSNTCPAGAAMRI